jgi:predicted nucleic acid-binding protein
VTLVVDASVVIAGLVDSGPEGTWAESVLVSGPLVAPQLLPAEVGNVMRRATLVGQLSQDVASLAHADLGDLNVAYVPYAPFAERIWELRSNLTTYDAWYVAIAEAIAAPLATLDVRLTESPGPRCEFSMPPLTPQ